MKLRLATIAKHGLSTCMLVLITTCAGTLAPGQELPGQAQAEEQRSVLVNLKDQPDRPSTNNNQLSNNSQQPLTAAQKVKFGARTAFLNPGAYIGPAFGAYFTEQNELRVPAKTREDYFADGLSFYARSFGRQAMANFFASGLYPALFRQDPRYYASPKSGVGARLLYAGSRTLLTRNDAGKMQFNYSKLAGFLTSTTLANAYERDTAKARDTQGRVISLYQRTGTSATFRNFGFLVVGDVIENVFFNEFRLGEKAGRAVRKLFGK